MTNEEILSKVKNDFGSYESISLANDDVERLLVIIRHIQMGAEMADAFDKIIEPTGNDIKNDSTAYN